MEKRDEAMKAVIEALVKELSRDPIAPEIVVAISKAIETLDGINPLTQTGNTKSPERPSGW